jgi:phospholipid/cholesterol/gamma-HCH transport system permease protein
MSMSQRELDLIRQAGDTLCARLAGSWKSEDRIPSLDEIQREIEAGPRVRRVVFDTEGLTGWDSGLLVFLRKVVEYCTENAIAVEKEGVIKILSLASEVPEQSDARKTSHRESFLSRIGTEVVGFGRSTVEMIDFIGQVTVAFERLLRGKARLRLKDFMELLERCGAQALPIVSLISLLVGLILAFVGAVQLVLFGAQIYVASLVGIGIVRVMGAIMTGVIMAGRTGAAFAAELGTMQVNEEIDALKTLGVSPIEFLVLPRVLSLALMMPLLCLYADLMGILGGLVVGVGMLNLDVMEYVNETRASVSLSDFWIGLFHSFVFGVLVALAGCLRGIQCGRSSADVGHAATSAVVTGIVSIVVATAIITVACNVLGI